MRLYRSAFSEHRSRLIATALGASFASLASMPDAVSERLFSIEDGKEVPHLLSTLDSIQATMLGTDPLAPHSLAALIPRRE